jgi:hypothetical protein
MPVWKTTTALPARDMRLYVRADTAISPKKARTTPIASRPSRLCRRQIFSSLASEFQVFLTAQEKFSKKSISRYRG